MATIVAMRAPGLRPLAATTLCLLLFVATRSHAQECGDLDNSGEIAATDALLLLNKAVAQPVPDLVCPLSVGLPATGQATCYSEAGDVIDCIGTGQDGELQRGVARSFIDNGDGTITDNVTALVWEKLSDDGSIHDKDNTYSWADAFASKVATLNATNFAGHSDWRVPNLVELESLRDNASVAPATHAEFNSGCVSACTELTCSCTTPLYYWSSTTYADTYADAPLDAWFVHFYVGFAGSIDKSNSYYVRAVRGGL